MITILTKTNSWYGPIASLLGLIMNALYNFFNLFGIQNIALTIIIFTFFVKALMLPLTIKQQKFSKLSSRMNPELQKIQAKYKGKKDEASIKKMNAEQQALYQKYGANPTSGCLPILITLPIMFALYAVINNIPAYVDHVYKLYENVAIQIQTVDGWQGSLKTMADSLKNVTGMPKTYTDSQSIIDVLKHFKTDTWTTFATTFQSIQGNVISGDTTITETIKNIKNVNSFLGLNIANAPGFKLTPAILIPILAGLLQYVQGKQIQIKTNDTNNQDNPAAAAMNSMTVVMPMMSAFFCITFPIGVGIYWIASSSFTIIQQFFVNKYMERIDVDDLIAKSVAKQSKRNKYLESKGISMADLAKTQTKNIESTVIENDNSIDKSEKESNEGMEETTVKTSNSTSTSGKSISEIANLLKNKNDKGDK